MSTVISVENVSKAYRLGQIGGGTLRADVSRWWAKLRGQPDPFLKIGEEHHARKMGEQFWALDNVSFQVKQGEVLGIIGRNGAGKSTLLKILSQVTTPTSGQIKIKGRIASLLEVGTGFNPEMTGRENVFLNGAILGMTKVEIRSKFDEIVAFSGVEEFIDTPVKRYSSGMYVRLAFAVAAHLEPEILIVDEVLAVGDAEFQKKCMNKIQEVSAGGRTILFVSHDVSAVTRLCGRAIMLQGGIVLAAGASQDVAAAYLRSTQRVTGERIWPDPVAAPQDKIARLMAVRIYNSARQVVEIFDVRERIGIELEFEVLEQGHLLVPCFSLKNETGQLICLLHDHTSSRHRKPRPVGRFRSVVWIPDNLMSEGSVIIGVAVGTHIPANILHFSEADVVGFRVVDSGMGDTARGDYGGHIPGIIRPHWRWETEFSPTNI